MMHRVFYAFSALLATFGVAMFADQSRVEQMFVSKDVYGSNTNLVIATAVALLIGVVGAWTWVFHARPDEQLSTRGVSTFYTLLALGFPAIVMTYPDLLGSLLQWTLTILGALIIVGGLACLLAGRASAYHQDDERYHLHS